MQFLISDFKGYCDYCYDGVKNYDEIEVDCGGPNCPDCMEERGFFDWVFWLLVILSLMLFLIFIVLVRDNTSNIHLAFANNLSSISGEDLKILKIRKEVEDGRTALRRNKTPEAREAYWDAANDYSVLSMGNKEIYELIRNLYKDILDKEASNLSDKAAKKINEGNYGEAKEIYDYLIKNYSLNGSKISKQIKKIKEELDNSGFNS